MNAKERVPESSQAPTVMMTSADHLALAITFQSKSYPSCNWPEPRVIAILGTHAGLEHSQVETTVRELVAFLSEAAIHQGATGQAVTETGM